MKQEQIDEWVESEVTQYFLGLLKSELDRVFSMRAEVYFPGEPFRTQEAKAMFIGQESSLKDVIEAIETKDFESLEVEEQDEQVGNTSERRPGIN